MRKRALHTESVLKIYMDRTEIKLVDRCIEKGIENRTQFSRNG